jgi:hypothetical protein
MKLNISMTLSLSGLVFAALRKRQDPPGCHADNCLRAIRATTQLPQASVDCVSPTYQTIRALLIAQQSSFLVETVTPPPVTVTITATIVAVAKRTTTYGPVIPTYASACTDVDEYSSACSCIGITATITTLLPSVHSCPHHSSIQSH